MHFAVVRAPPSQLPRRCEAALGSGAKEEKGKGRSRGQAAGKSEAKSVNEVREPLRDRLGSAGERRSSLDEAWRGQGVPVFRTFLESGSVFLYLSGRKYMSSTFS